MRAGGRLSAGPVKPKEKVPDSQLPRTEEPGAAQGVPAVRVPSVQMRVDTEAAALRTFTHGMTRVNRAYSQGER